MKLTSKLLSLLLALVLVMTLTPAIARAEETTVETGTVPVEIPFRINPLYEGLITEADLEIPEFPENDPNQLRPNAVTYLTVEKAGAEFRKQMKNRTETFTIYVKSESSNSNVVGNAILAEALKHTGVATEGDYLMWQYGGAEASGYRSYNSTTKMYEYELNFTVPYYTTAAQEKEMNTAVTNLINSLGVKYKTDYEKIDAVYDWLCQNVTYDYENLEDTSYLLKHTAYAALIDRTAVCQGYAVLFYRLMLELNVDARVIVGDGGGPHAWNIVELNNLYYNLDSTWDAGQSEYIWFLNSYWDFVGHEREMAYDTIAFHNEYPLAAESYEAGKTATKDPYICAGYCGTADTEHTNAEWWLGRDGSLTIKGTGETYDFGLNSSERPYYFYWESEITKVVVESGITGLGEYSFYAFTGLKEASLPSTLKTVGKNAFYKCDNLQTVTCAEGLETIEASAFAYCGSLKTVKLPASLKTIGGGAFTECTSLTAITLPTGLESLGAGTFYDCSGLKSITIPGTTAVGKQAFANCTALETVTITDGMTEIPQELFMWCRNLKTVKLPGSVKQIGFRAFEGCEVLASVTLPANLETIGSYAFAYCNLTSVAIPETVTTIGDHAFTNNSGLKTANLPKGLSTIANGIFSNCALEKIEIPAGVTVIGEYAFSGAQVTSLTIPEGVTRIEKGAFSGAKKLTKVTLPSTLEFFSGFSYCTSLTSIVIPEGVTEIGTCAFQESSGLTSVTIPDTVTKIGSTAFNACTSLKSIELPEGITEIPRNAFSSCTSLKTVIIPESVTTFGDEAFRYCSALTEIPLPESITKVGSSCFADCDSLTEVTMPASVTNVGTDIFSGCDNLQKATVATLADHMFENCPKLHTVELLDTVTRLGGYAFRNCDSLTSLTVPASVTEVRGSCFYECSNLKEIHFTGNAPKFYWNSFEDITATVYYPGNNPTWTASVLQDYYGDITWVPVLKTLATGWSGATQWRLTDDGALRFSGTGNMKNYGYNRNQPWLSYADQITSVVIGDGITTIGSGAFMDLTRLERVTFPESGLTKIGDAAFYGCTSLKEVYIPEGIYTLWSYTFKNCSSLAYVQMPNTLIKIDQGTFENCTSLSFVNMPSNVQIIGSWSFKGCTGLTSAGMSYAVATEIREGAFKNCSSLTMIQLPYNIQKLGDSAFYGIGAEIFTIPATVTEVGPWCFARAYSLKDLYFDGNAPTIGEGAFNKITLTAHYPSGNATWTPAIMQHYGGTVTWTAN